MLTLIGHCGNYMLIDEKNKEVIIKWVDTKISFNDILKRAMRMASAYNTHILISAQIIKEEENKKYKTRR